MLMNFPLSILPKVQHAKLNFVHTPYFLKSIWKKNSKIQMNHNFFLYKLLFEPGDSLLLGKHC